MLDSAQQGGYAYPAINCANLSTLNAAMKGFADNKSDGIIQFSTGAGQFASGLNHKNATLGTIILAEAAHALAEQYDVLIALNTDHCQPDKAADFLAPLIEATAKRRAEGKNNLFQNHMLDASILPLAENMAISQEYLKLCAKQEIILEVEAGVVGGEEDGAAGSEDTPDEDMYTTTEDMIAVHEALSPLGRFTFAATFGNVHGHYKPGAVKLQPRDPQRRPGCSQSEIRRQRRVRPRVPRRIRQLVRRDPRNPRLRRGEDERRHRHPVRLHPPDRRPLL